MSAVFQNSLGRLHCRQRYSGYNGPVVETFYRTGAPEREKSECYVLVLASRAGSEGKAYLFMQEHGCWDDSFEQFLFHVDSIRADEGTTYQLALGMYENAKGRLADQGFVHSSSLNNAHREEDSHRASSSGSTVR